jgi:hypothetical protein
VVNTTVQENRFVIIHIFTGDDGKSDIVERVMHLAPARVPAVTESISHGKGAFFRFLSIDEKPAFHNASRRQFTVNFSGRLSVETRAGTRRVIAPGEIVFVEDTEGEGHRTEVLESGLALFMPVSAEFDLAHWIESVSA